MSAPEPLHEHAMENLRFIRDAMARAGAFTALPGWGGVLMGTTALVVAPIAGPPDGSFRWLAMWIVEAAIAAAIAETGATSIKDMGRVVGALKAKYAGRMDIGKASATVKAKLGG